MNINKIPFVIAHRGASSYAPENTLAAMQKAYELGCKWVEFDIMLSQDEQPIVIHDTKIDRTTNSCGEVIAFNAQTLCSLDAGSWFDPDFSHERIPTFSELSQWLQNYKMNAVIEVKPYPGKEVATAEKVVNMMSNKQLTSVVDIICSSFSYESLRSLRKFDIDLPLGYGMDIWHTNWEEKAKALACCSIHVNENLLQAKKDVTKLKENIKYVFAYTVNEKKRAKELFSWGVDAIFSDCPDKV